MTGDILKIRDKDGNFVGVPAIVGPSGKSAYESALDGGFIGTEEEFNQAIAELMPNTEHTENKDNPHEVTAEQVGALPITGGVLNGDLFIRDKEGKSLPFFGEHNKPSGSYVGKDEGQTIQIGGSGLFLLILSSKHEFAIVTPIWARVWRGAIVTCYTELEANFFDGELIISSTYEGINESGVTYHYQVL